MHSSFTTYMCQNPVVVSFQKKKKNYGSGARGERTVGYLGNYCKWGSFGESKGSCVSSISAERVFSLLATMFGDQQHETLEEYIAAALILHVSNR